ncbi:MAG: DUF5103 domain-containing protein [Saprospiraceae bacterium]|nr:DUF5103 domain-containing protein [Saprospiraceae bacterium]
MKVILTFLFGLGAFSLFGQQAPDNVFDPNIKSVKIIGGKDQLSYPIYYVNSSNYVYLSFDDLNEDRNLGYRIRYCNSDWTISDLFYSEFIDGFQEEYLDDYEFSFNTIVDYANYGIVLPNKSLGFKLTGNYVIEVFDTESDLVLLSKRFMVAQAKVGIDHRIGRASLNSKLETHQELDFYVKHESFDIQNPRSTLKATVVQNKRWDTAIYDIKPSFVRIDMIDFDYQNKIVFEAGKEFRYFDIRNLTIPPSHIEAVSRTFEDIDVTIERQRLRSNIAYFESNDINGAYIIAADDKTNPLLSGEYVDVLFVYNRPFENMESSYYVFGEFTSYNRQESGRMVYNDALKAYVCKMRLKQGYYNYYFVEQANGKDDIDYEITEGNWYETENEYAILIYYRPFGARFDQLIGVKTISSRP